MANEITLALLTSASLVDYIRQRALWYATHQFVMSRLVTSFTDAKGFASRTTSGYSESGAPTEVAETDDLSPMSFTRAALETLVPKEVAKQFIITDRRIETDTENVLADAIADIGYTVGKYVEKDLLGLFSNFTGGIYGSENTRMNLGTLYAARARLEHAGIPGPYVTVMDTYQYLDIFSDLTDLSKPAALGIREMAQQQYFVTQIADFYVVVSSLLPRTSVQNEKQSITITGTPTGGTYKLAFAEQATAALAYNANAAAIQAALIALPNVGTGNVEVTGTGPYVVEFKGTLAGENVPLMTLHTNALTGGTTPSVTLAVTQEGKNYAQGGMFTRDALAIDLRRPMRIEPERDASMRWTELNTTMVYASGKWRPERGVILRSDASTPLNDQLTPAS